MHANKYTFIILGKLCEQVQRYTNCSLVDGENLEKYMRSPFYISHYELNVEAMSPEFDYYEVLTKPKKITDIRRHKLPRTDKTFEFIANLLFYHVV